MPVLSRPVNTSGRPPRLPAQPEEKRRSWARFWQYLCRKFNIKRSSHDENGLSVIEEEDEENFLPADAQDTTWTPPSTWQVVRSTENYHPPPWVSLIPNPTPPSIKHPALRGSLTHHEFNVTAATAPSQSPAQVNSGSQVFVFVANIPSNPSLTLPRAGSNPSSVNAEQDARAGAQQEGTEIDEDDGEDGGVSLLEDDDEDGGVLLTALDGDQDAEDGGVALPKDLPGPDGEVEEDGGVSLAS